MMLCSSVSAILFLSTPSARRATAAKGQGNIHVQISIHALREEGDAQHPDTAISPKISIHALREEGDQAPQTRKEQAKYFYPRPPRGGRRRR